MPIKNDYLNVLRERGKQSRVYKKYQLIGLIIAQLLEDEKHKSLYIKLAKEYNQETLMRIAKDVAERKQIKNKGGYFMRVLQRLKFPRSKTKKKNGKSNNKNSNNK